MNFPETIYLFITLHGIIELDENEQLNEFNLPLDLVYIPAAPPDVQCILSETIEADIHDLHVKLKENTKDEETFLMETISLLKDKYAIDTHNNQRFLQYNYEKNAKCMNKQFILEDDNDYEQRINIVNMETLYDLIEIILFVDKTAATLPYYSMNTAGDKLYINMEQICHYLKNHGVKKIILFDYSCSDIYTKKRVNNQLVYVKPNEETIRAIYNNTTTKRKYSAGKNSKHQTKQKIQKTKQKYSQKRLRRKFKNP